MSAKKRQPRQGKDAKPKRGKRTASSTSVRLQRFLAQAGYGSRRDCEELIREGRVTVDGEIVQRMGTQVPHDCATVQLDGTPVKPARFQYFMVHKPTGVVSTCRDPAGRLRVIDLINTDMRVYNVGRLDKSSEGLILVTNDGELANRLTHPRYGVPKTYQVTVAGNPRWSDLQLLKRGIRLAEAVAKVDDVKIKKRRRDSVELRIVLTEGRNREIRRLLAHIGHKVLRLKRTAIGPLNLGSLPPGDYRRLEHEEIEALKRASANVQQPKRRRSKPVETSQLKSGRGQKKKSSRKKKKAGKRKKIGTRKKKSGGSSQRGQSNSRKSSSSTSSTRKKKGRKIGERRRH